MDALTGRCRSVLQRLANGTAGPTLIDSNLLGQAMTANGLLQLALGNFLISVRSEQEVNHLAFFNQ